MLSLKINLGCVSSVLLIIAGLDENHNASISKTKFKNNTPKFIDNYLKVFLRHNTTRREL